MASCAELCAELWAEHKKPVYKIVTKDDYTLRRVKGFKFDMKMGGFIAVLYEKGTLDTANPTLLFITQVRGIDEANELLKVIKTSSANDIELFNECDLFSDRTRV